MTGRPSLIARGAPDPRRLDSGLESMLKGGNKPYASQAALA
jgi:hypothetical protein